MALYVVTGGAGFIGSNIVEELVKRGEKVRVIDNFSNGKMENIQPFLSNIELFRGDIRDIDTVRQVLKGADYVLHQAALGSIPRSIANPIETNSCNADGTLNMLVASKEMGIKRFVYASSSSVYGNSEELPKKENMITKPCSPYGVSKLIGEMYCRVFFDVYELKTVILRYFNVFGKHQDPTSQYAAVIPKFITEIQRGVPPVIFGDGEQTRDFTYVSNVVEANLMACSQDIEMYGEPFNIAFGEKHSVIELFNRVASILSKEISPRFQEGRKGEIKHSYADTSKARSIFGYKPLIDFKSGIELAIEWYKKEYSALLQ